ncbi:hypothetical protein ZEAMMB73_Zm00001d015272 [Zea mays]|uniref:Uncharacterized protein n=1 Tax=Zea mays TaxID=4577 RepID=A0A1D6H0W8_MAIZE|nr:hypothetical protein ZEAMMB73_Zm00001d015272 [Zea mays]
MSLSDLLSEVTNKLTSLGDAVFPSGSSEIEGLNFCTLSCVDLVARSFQSLQEKLEAAQIDNAQLNSSLVELRKAIGVAQERSEHADGIVKKLYDSLQELLCDSLGSSNEFGARYSVEEPIESQYGRLIAHLKNLLHDHHSALSTNAELELSLLSKCEEVEELNMRCSSLLKKLDEVCILNEELKSASSSKNVTLDKLHSRCLTVAEMLASCSANHSSTVQLISDIGEGSSKEDHILTTLLPCIEADVASCIEKFENAAEEIRLSKICLQEISIFDQISFEKWSYPLPTLIKEEVLPKICDLQDRFDQLNALNIQLETEVAVLKDGMKELDEDLGTSRSELQKKVSELEQLDQKFSSVKEKLSIAVAKGKGLIVQRDSLKQSLLEKSGEIEKLTQELQLKETLLKELEAKLKSYTEADRIEALESELSYIRNSATALRDSFLLKDSVLQRIEEVLEELDLPEQFHSRDIVEKIELLSKPSKDASKSDTGAYEKEMELNSLNNELDHAHNNLALAQQECDEAVEKAQSLMMEIETLHAQISKLQESDAEQMQKKEMELNSLNNELDHARNNLALVEQERDEAVEKAQSLMMEIETLHAQISKLQESDAEQMQKYQSLVLELESVGKQRDNLQERLNQEEQKCASLREKLNVAVRKGKGLVQHRDSLKQTMEEMNVVIEKLKSERKQHIESLETEKSSLMDRLAENEKSLHETNQYLSGLLNALNRVDVAREFDMDPITKVEKMAKFFLDLQSTVASSQNEVMKSKRATELLLAELNEAHERADNLQEELVKAEAALSESSKQYIVTESARADAVRQLELIMHAQSQTRRRQADHLLELNSTSSQLREVCFELSHCLVNTFSKDVDLICYVVNFMRSSGKLMDDTNTMDIPIASKHVLSNRTNNKKAHIPNAPLEIKTDDTDDSQFLHHLAIACHALSDCVKDCNDLKRNIDEHDFSVEQKATELFDVMSTLKNRFTSQHNELESLRAKFVELQSEMEERDKEIIFAQRNMSLLYEACASSVAEIEGISDIYPGKHSYAVEHSADECIKSIVEQLVMAVKTSQNSNEGSTKELKAIVLELQQELQAKDVQISTISSDLSYQLRVAESSAKQFSVDLEDARMELQNLEKQVDVLQNQKKDLETQLNELKNMESMASEQHGRIEKLTDELSRKDQEIEGLVQALDEEEKELEILENKSLQLEQMLQEKEFALKTSEVSRTKALAKLATTVDKFDELHSLSENLLAEVENLQLQLQERDSEISFLRKEVTKSTNELLTTEESNKNYSSQLNGFMKWLERELLQFGFHSESANDYDYTQFPVYMDMLDKKIGSLIAESDDLRVTVQSKDSLLQVERAKIEELMRKSDGLEASLSQKDSQIGLLRRDRASNQQSRSINLPGTSEIEQMNDKVSPAAVVTQIRGARKVINDQVAIDVEMEKDKPFDDEDDDKAHGFKSLTMSRFVPKFTRPVSDRIDGMWVSGDRLLMRQPTLRLGVLIYWIALHALLASFI